MPARFGTLRLASLSAVLTGCTAFGSSGETAQPGGDAGGGVNPVAEAGADGRTAGAGNPSFCAANPGGVYCRDFDDGEPVTAGFTIADLPTPAISFAAATSYVSPPTGLRLSVQPNASSDVRRGFVEQKLVIPVEANGVSCGATVVPEAGSFPDQILGFAIDNWLLEIRAHEGTGAIYMSNTPPFESSAATGTLVRGVSHRLTLRLYRPGREGCATNSQARILLNDTEIASRCVGIPSLSVRLRLGASFLDRPVEGWTALYDDVRCEPL